MSEASKIHSEYLRPSDGIPAGGRVDRLPSFLQRQINARLKLVRNQIGTHPKFADIQIRWKAPWILYADPNCVYPGIALKFILATSHLVTRRTVFCKLIRIT